MRSYSGKFIAGAWLLIVIISLSLLLPTAAFADDNKDNSAKAAEYKESWKRFEGKTTAEIFDEFGAEHRVTENTVGFCYYNTVSGDEYVYNGDRFIVAGSLYKLPLNMYFCDRIYEGEMDWDTMLFGRKYSEIIDWSVTYSSNGISELLQQELGPYPTYRRTISPYVGITDEEAFDFNYLNRNLFNVNGMLTCLKSIYFSPERYGEIVNCMLRANPGEFFEGADLDIEIAQKYGYLTYDDFRFLHVAGILYTEDPVIAIVMTENAYGAYKLIPDLAEIAADYADYSKYRRGIEEAERAEEERIAAEKAAEEEAERQRLEAEEASQRANEEARKAAAEEKLSSQAAKKQAELENRKARNEAVKGNPFDIKISRTIVIAFAAILAAALLIFVLMRKKVNVIFAILAVAVILAAGAVTLFGHEHGTIISKADGDPGLVTKEFFDGFVSGDYEKSYALLADFSNLGLDAKFDDKYERAVYDALKRSYSYELPYDPVIDSFTAEQVVIFTYLDVPSLKEDLKLSVDAALAEAIETMDKREYLGENGDYAPEFIDSLWDTAFTEVMKNVGAYNVSKVLSLTLNYNSGVWTINSDRTLLNALSGGTYGA